MAGFLEGKVVAVTGGGGGIGRAVALAAAAEGAKVLVADYGVGMAGEDPSSEVADAVVDEITEAGGEALAVADDISKMESGERLIATAVETYGRIDGVVAVAGILRERMLFNMSEDEWDSVVATHLKGHFTVFRAAAAVMRKQEGGGALVGFTSGAFSGSVAQANYAAAKGGIVSLVRSAAAGLYRYGVTANAIAPVARTRMSANVPAELAEMRRPRGRGADGRLPPERPGQARDRPGLHRGGFEDRRVESAEEVRAMWADGRWTPQQIAERLDSNIGQERMGLIDRLEQMRQAAASGEKPNA